MRTGTSLKSVALLTFIFVAAVAVICISVSDGSVAAADGSSDYYKEQLSGKEKEVYNIIYPVAFALDSGYTTVAFTAADFSDIESFLAKVFTKLVMLSINSISRHM